MAYSEEVKQKILNRIENGDKIKDISEETGISIPTLYNWRNKANLSKENQGKGETNKSTNIEQLKIIKRLIKEKRFQEAKKIVERFPDYKPIQSQMLKIAIKEGDLKRAKEIGERFPKDVPMQSQMLKIAIKEGDLKRAKEIGEKFQNNATIQSQMLKIAIKEGDLKRAKEIGERFPKDVPMQSQMLKIAIKEEDFARAKEIGDRFPNNETIQSQMLRIARMKKSEETMLEQNFENDESDKSKKILNRLKTQIYYDQIDNQLISDIESSEELSDFEKIVSILAICEKRNMKGKAKDVLKKFKLTDKKEKGIVQGIMDRIQSKKLHIFDISKYSPILQWSYDEELKTQYEDELGKERETNRELKKQSATICSQINTNPSTVKQPDGSTPNPPIPKSPIIGKKSDSGAEYRRSLVVRNIGDSKPEELPKEQKIKNQTQKKIDYIHKFVQEQRKLVYVKMQSQSPEVQADAINKWDRMEILLEKIAKRSTDTQYIENLYNRVLNLSKSNDKGMEY